MVTSYEQAKSARAEQVEREVLRMRELPQGREREAAAATFLRSMRRFLEARVGWFVGDDVERDDLRAVAQVALWRAVETWRPDGGRSFLTFARWGVRNALELHVNADRQVRCGRRLSTVSIDDNDNADESPALYLADPADDPEAALLRREQRERVREALARLPAEQRVLLEAVAGGELIKDSGGRRAWELAKGALLEELRRTR